MGPMSIESRTGGAAEDARIVEKRSRIWQAAALVLDLVIAAYAAALAILAVTGGVDLPLLTLHGAAKPLLVVVILLPIRLTMGGDSWLSAQVRGPVAGAWARMRTAVCARLSPAVIDVGFAYLTTRLAIVATGFIAVVLFSTWMPPSITFPFRAEKLWAVFAAFDSGWYFDIAKRGYFFSTTGTSSIAFFPLYPLAMRALAWPFGGGDRAIWIAGLVISAVAFALALLAIYQLTEKVLGDRQSARQTVLYLAVYPFSFFFTSVYTESLFLLTSVLACSCAYDKQWIRAGLWGALATLTRPNGILIGVPLLLLAVQDRSKPKDLAGRLAALLPVPAAMAGFCAFAYRLSGNPLGWLAAQAQWGYSIGHRPWQQLQTVLELVLRNGLYDYFVVSKLSPFWLFHGVVALIFLALTPAVFKRLGLAMGAYVLVSLLVPLSGSGLEGIGRYAAVLFPVFMLAGTNRSPRLHEAILIVCSIFLALFASLFVTLHPVY